jgi:predicted phosphodiesterase
MRIAALSDIHGNPYAFDAVVADARAQGVEEHWLIGDFVAIGPEPTAVLERVAALGRAHCTRGNTDRYTATGERPPPDLDAVRADPDLIPLYAAISASFGWTRGYVTCSGWLEWLRTLPLELRRDDVGGLRVLAVHAAPGTDDGEGVHPGRSDVELGTLLDGENADIVFVGHTHEPMIRRVDGRVVVNLGSVSNPRGADVRASYVLLDIDDGGMTIEHRRVSYDRDAFTESVRRSGHPSTNFILRHHRGEMAGRPPHADHATASPGTRLRVTAPSTT